jgi:HD-like signal output (HDOD) protein
MDLTQTMDGPQKKDSASFDRLLFAGLSDKEIVSLYNVGVVKTVNSLEFLAREGEPDPSVYLVTSGSLKLTHKPPGGGNDVTVAHCARGAWLGGGPEADRTESPFSLFSPEHSTVLVIDKAAFDMLGARAKSFLRAALSTHTAQIMRRLADESALRARQNDALTTFFANAREDARRDYPRVEMIEDLLNGLPRLPLFVDKVTAMLLSDTVSTTEIVEYAKTDPSIVSATLKRINSPYYNFREKITDFHRAVMLLGFNQIYQIALEECVFELFPKSFRTREFHLHSILISLIGFELATLTGAQKPAAVSTVCLIHDIGYVLLQLLKNKNPDMVHLVEGLDGSQIAAMLFEKWAFPASICGTIRFQHYAGFAPPARIPEAYRENVALLHVGHLLCEYMQNGEGPASSRIFSDEYMDFLGFEGLSIKELAEKSVYPPLVKKINFLPEDIRHLIEANLGR